MCSTAGTSWLPFVWGREFTEDLGIVMKRMSSGDTLLMQLKLFGQLKEKCEDQLAIFSIVNSVQVKYEFQSLNPTPVDLSEYLH